MQKNVLQIILILTLSACSASFFEDDMIPLSELDALIAAQVIGESVSENQGGLISNFQEAFAIPTSQGLIQGPTLLSSESFRNLQNYQYQYNPSTGIHKVTFNRNLSDEILQTSIAYTIEYRFYDRDRNLLPNPSTDPTKIEAVIIQSTRIGSITDGTKESDFRRNDHLIMDGVNDQSATLYLDGSHSAIGHFVYTDTLGVKQEREYILDIDFLNIRISKQQVMENRNFRTGVLGTLAYESTITHRGNGNSGTQIINGTIELTGDGTAILRFREREQEEPHKIRLSSGSAVGPNGILGELAEINLFTRTFRLTSGEVYRVTNQTRIIGGMLNSLEEVAVLLATGEKIIAKGQACPSQDNTEPRIAVGVEFEPENDRLRDRVISVDLALRTITLANAGELLILPSSRLIFEGSLQSLGDVDRVVRSGGEVYAEVEFQIQGMTGRRVVRNATFYDNPSGKTVP